MAAENLLNQLEQAVRLNLPLPPVVRAMADERRGRLARELRQAADSLERGAPLAVALSAAPVSSRELGLIAGAENVGRLQPVLSRLVEARRRAGGSARRRISFAVYPIALGIVFIAIASMLMIIVMPRFETIFKDFQIPLPRVTVALLQAANRIGLWAIVLLALLIIALILNISSPRLWRAEGPFKLIIALIFDISSLRLWQFEGPFQWLADRLPWIGAVRTHRALGEVLEFTAEGVESGRTIESSLTESAQTCSSSRLRENIKQWVAGIASGQGLADAARAAGMPPLVCGMLATAVHTPDIASILQFLGRYYAMRFSRAILLLEAAAVPALSICMGLMVGWVALSIILPMIRLIDRCSSIGIGL